MGEVAGLVVGAADAEVVDGVIDEAGVELDGEAEEAAGSGDLLDDEAGVVGGEFEAFFLGDAIDDAVEDLVVEFHAVLGGFNFKDAVEVFEAGSGDLDFVGQSAEEGGVHEVFGVEVGGEDEEFLEGDAEGFTVLEAEEVHSAFEWDDPAVEQVSGAEELSAEVIDEEATAECLHVEWGLVKVADVVVAEVEHFECELAAGDDDGPAAGHPTHVMGAVADEGEVIFPDGDIVFDGFVDAHVEDADDLPVDGDGVGNEDDLFKYGGEADGDGGFAVSWGAVEEDGAATGHCGAALLDEAVVDDEVSEGLANAFRGDDLVVELLAGDLLCEVVEGYRSGTGVAGDLESVEGLSFAVVGEGIADICEFCVGASV